MPIPTELFVTIAARFTPDNEPANPTAALRVWDALFDRLTPLLGPLGAHLLLARSLDIQAAAFPSLSHPLPAEYQACRALFEHSLRELAPADLATVNVALLGTYTTVLADLIGERLATRLLRTTFQETKAEKN